MNKDFMEGLLEHAAKQVTKIKHKQHGDAKESFEFVAGLWSVYLNTDVKPHDVPQMMALLKMGRMKFGEYNVDDHIDAIGYAALAAKLHSASNGIEVF
tara:strand:- start:5861 stop:6154 length:294 start_codon:yes stop_codon:yes gene_type:complete